MATYVPIHHIDEPPDPTYTDNEELIVDEWGVPYLDQWTKAQRTTPIQKRSKEDSDFVRDRLSQVGALLKLRKSNGEIKRALSSLWGIDSRSVEKYLCVAVAMHRDIVTGRDHNAVKGDAAAWWGQELERLTRRQQTAGKMAESAQKLAEQGEGLLAESERIDLDSVPQFTKAGDPSKAYTALLNRKTALAHSADGVISKAADLLESARKMQGNAERLMHEVNRDLDRIMGTYAPVKVQHEGQVGMDVNGSLTLQAGTTEPATLEEARKQTKQWLLSDPVGQQLLTEMYAENPELFGIRRIDCVDPL